MSTISDALKKVQKQRLGSQAFDDVVPHAPPLDPQKPFSVPPYASGRPSFIMILVCVTIVAMVLFYFLCGSNEGGLGDGFLSIPATHAEVAASSPKPEGVDIPLKSAVRGEGGTTDVVVSQPSHPKVARTDIPVLKGIFYSEKNPVAIINGTVMKEGEQIGAYYVVKISAYSVRLNCEGEEFALRLE
jgi:hypothetical protein